MKYGQSEIETMMEKDHSSDEPDDAHEKLDHENREGNMCLTMPTTSSLCQVGKNRNELIPLEDFFTGEADASPSPE